MLIQGRVYREFQGSSLEQAGPKGPDWCFPLLRCLNCHCFRLLSLFPLCLLSHFPLCGWCQGNGGHFWDPAKGDLGKRFVIKSLALFSVVRLLTAFQPRPYHFPFRPSCGQADRKAWVFPLRHRRKFTPCEPLPTCAGTLAPVPHPNHHERPKPTFFLSSLQPFLDRHGGLPCSPQKDSWHK